MNTKNYHIVKTMCGFHFKPQHHGVEGWTCWLWWSWRPLTDKEREERDEGDQETD